MLRQPAMWATRAAPGRPSCCAPACLLPPPACRDNLIESAEDIGSHLRRSIKELPTTKAFDKLVGNEGRLRLQATKPVVLILGSGWGAHSMMKVGGWVWGWEGSLGLRDALRVCQDNEHALPGA